jgi:hypothetical protein
MVDSAAAQGRSAGAKGRSAGALVSSSVPRSHRIADAHVQEDGVGVAGGAAWRAQGRQEGRRGGCDLVSVLTDATARDARYGTVSGFSTAGSKFVSIVRRARMVSTGDNEI